MIAKDNGAHTGKKRDEIRGGKETDDRNAKSDRGNSSLPRGRHSIQVSISREWLDPFSGIVSASISPFSLPPCSLLSIGITPVIARDASHLDLLRRRRYVTPLVPSNIFAFDIPGNPRVRPRPRYSSPTKCPRLFPPRKNITEYNFRISCIYLFYFLHVSLCDISLEKRLKIIFTRVIK